MTSAFRSDLHLNIAPEVHYLHRVFLFREKENFPFVSTGSNKNRSWNQRRQREETEKRQRKWSICKRTREAIKKHKIRKLRKWVFGFPFSRRRRRCYLSTAMLLYAVKLRWIFIVLSDILCRRVAMYISIACSHADRAKSAMVLMLIRTHRTNLYARCLGETSAHDTEAFFRLFDSVHFRRMSRIICINLCIFWFVSYHTHTQTHIKRYKTKT